MPLNPQQSAFKEAYIDPGSPTFGNAYRSALSVGYTEEYSKVITAQGYDWYSEILRDVRRMQKAETALDDTLDFSETDPANRGLRLKAAIFVAEGLGKAKYSKKTEAEHTGSVLFTFPSELIEKNAINAIAKQNS